ncbi:MAG: WD40/YVTN/BNR-like repeat-containing protein [Thermodesulfovibrionales bacterium]
MKTGSRHHFFVISLIFFFLFLSRFSYADPLDSWHVRNYSSNGNALNSVTYGNGLFVAVGYAGTIITSPDGVNWTSRSSGTSADLNDVTNGNGMFVAVGLDGTILSSRDGLNWTTGSSGTSATLTSVAYGGGVFVVLGAAALTSQDGVQWAVRAEVRSRRLRFADDKFIAVAAFGPGGIYESLDGITWSFKPRGDGSDDFYTDIVLHKGTYVVVGSVGTFEISPIPASEAIFTSADGTSWKQTNSSGGMLDGRSFWINGINYGNGYFVAVSSAGRVFHSTDGYSWTLTKTETNDWLYSVAYGNHTFVAVGDNSVILQSDPLSGNCTATLSPDLTLHIPILNFNGSYIGGDAACETAAGSSIICRVTNHGKVNSQDFADCQPSTLTQDLKLHIPAGIYNNISYEVDFEHVPSDDKQIWFTLSYAKRN